MEGEIRSCLIIINIYITTLSDRVPSHDIQVPFDSKFSSLQLFIKFIKHNGWFSLLSSSPSRKKLTCNHHLIHKGTVSNQKKDYNITTNHSTQIQQQERRDHSYLNHHKHLYQTLHSSSLSNTNNFRVLSL